MKIIFLVIAFAGLAFFPSLNAFGEEKTITPPDELITAIEQSYPDTSITKRNKFHDQECGKDFGTNHPGLISADFNGDKILDYAVLLISNKPKAQNNYNPLDPLYDFTFAVFLGEKNKQFKVIEFWKYQHPIGTPWMLLLHDEKTVYDYDKDKKIKIKYPAIRPTRCGGGHFTIYWNGKDFSTAGGS